MSIWPIVRIQDLDIRYILPGFITFSVSRFVVVGNLTTSGYWLGYTNKMSIPSQILSQKMHIANCVHKNWPTVPNHRARNCPNPSQNYDSICRPTWRKRQYKNLIVPKLLSTGEERRLSSTAEERMRASEDPTCDASAYFDWGPVWRFVTSSNVGFCCQLLMCCFHQYNFKCAVRCVM